MSDKEEDFTRVFVWVLASLVLFTIIVILLARYVGLDENSGSMADKDIDERTRPYGTVNLAAPAENTVIETAPAVEAAPTSSKATPELDGQALYAACAGCHDTGVASAPVTGNAAAWATRVSSGIDALVTSAIFGKNGMPPKGGRADLSDAQIKAIVEYMVDTSK